jgi:hypothetical protein
MEPTDTVDQQKDIAALQDRIARAEAERDTWRVAGLQEKYLEASSMVAALELQLEGLRDAARGYCAIRVPDTSMNT